MAKVPFKCSCELSLIFQYSLGERKKKKKKERGWKDGGRGGMALASGCRRKSHWVMTIEKT